MRASLLVLALLLAGCPEPAPVDDDGFAVDELNSALEASVRETRRERKPSSSSGGGFGSAADASSSGPAASCGGSLLVRDERTGAALAGGGSVRFADVRSCSATFDEATGHASFTLFCGAEAAMPAGGAEVPRRLLEVRVDGAVAARRWALEIERRAREAREGETSSTKGA